MERLRGTAAPSGTGQLGRVPGTPAQAALATHGAPAGEGHFHWRGPTSGVTGSLAKEAVFAYGAPTECGKPPAARDRQLGGRGVLPRRRSLPLDRV